MSVWGLDWSSEVRNERGIGYLFLPQIVTFMALTKTTYFRFRPDWDLCNNYSFIGLVFKTQPADKAGAWIGIKQVLVLSNSLMQRCFGVLLIHVLGIVSFMWWQSCVGTPTVFLMWDVEKQVFISLGYGVFTFIRFVFLDYYNYSQQIMYSDVQTPYYYSIPDGILLHKIQRLKVILESLYLQSLIMLPSLISIAYLPTHAHTFLHMNVKINVIKISLTSEDHLVLASKDISVASSGKPIILLSFRAGFIN